MNEKSKVFKKLLTVEELFTLYKGLSKTILNKIDVENLGYDVVATKNSIILLCEMGLVCYKDDNFTFQKISSEISEYNVFLEVLYERLKSSYSDAFVFFEKADLRYDEAEAKLYMKRNSVKLDLSGLLMLLDGVGKIEIKQNDIFILDKSLLRCHSHNKTGSRSPISLEDLKYQLEINEKHGIEAELAAVEYEAMVLKNAGIDKTPERISEFHTNAGYDIVSFMMIDSHIPDKFIEVKSCADNRWTFYISKNELAVARNKQYSYYLYLYNRKEQKFRIIQNPYDYLMNNMEQGQWVMEPQSYQVRCVGMD